MTNLFPRSYVVDRIDARIGNIDLEINRLQPQIDAWKVAQVEVLDRHLETVVGTLENLAVRLKTVTKEYGKATTYDAKRRLLESFNGHISFPYLPRIMDNQTSKGGSMSIGDVTKTVAGLRVEKNSLIHAKTYLETMPVDEFSMTSLSKLGLTQVLKFRLEEYTETKS